MNKVLIFAVCLASSVLTANADSNITVPNNLIKVQKGEAKTFVVELSNGDDISAVQANITKMPESVTVNGASSLTGDSLKYSATSNVDGTPVVVTYNLNDYPAAPAQAAFNSGKLFEISLTADASKVKTEITLTPKASKIGGAPVSVEPITVNVRLNGDINDDGVVAVNDLVLNAANVADGSDYSYIADFNNDGQLAVNDLVLMATSVADNSAKKGQPLDDEE